MSKRQSNYIARVRAAARKQVTELHGIHTQMCLDAAIVAANEVLDLGPTRVKAFVEEFSDALMAIAKMGVEDTQDMEFTKTKVDARLKEICGENFVPWDERYR